MVRVSERALDGEDSGVSSLLPRSVIAASVTTSGLDVRNRKVLFDQVLVDLGQLAISVVGDNADFLSSPLLDPGGHVKLAHGDDLDTAGLVITGDGLRTQKTSLLNISVSSTRDNENDGRDGPRRSTSGIRRCG